MSAIEIQVDELFSAVCPHCYFIHEPYEGASEMWSDRCIIWCYSCGRPYYYLIGELKPNWEI